MLRVEGEDILAYRKKLIKKDMELPIWEREVLTFEEAAMYSGVGVSKLRKLAMKKNCTFSISDGKRILIVRKKFDSFMDKQSKI